MKTPRPHQLDTIHRLRLSLASGKRRPMVQLPTGAGKTHIAAMIIDSALDKGKRVCFVVPAISLIDQTVEAFMAEGIREIGVMQASHEMTNAEMSVQVASVQTLARRKLPEVDLVIIDEAHRDFRVTNEWMNHEDWQRVPFIGLSATPWTKGLAKVYDDLIIGETTQGLIDKGFLSPFRVFAPSHPDLTGVKTRGGDYDESQLAQVMEAGGLVGGIVSNWLERGEDRPTLCFAVNRAHARSIQEAFIGAGVDCGYIDAFTEAAERKEIQRQFEHGSMRVVCNVGCLTTGVDWDVRCVILARPTKSLMLYVQMIGRGLRTADGKENCVILDHADNTLRMGFVTDIQKEELCDGRKKQSSSESEEREEPLPKECPSCTFLKPAKVPVCPSCGFAPQRQADIFETDDHLVEIEGKGKAKRAKEGRKYSMAEKQVWYSSFIWIARQRGYSAKWPLAQYQAKFGVWPNLLSATPMEPPPEVESYVKARMIAFAKGRKAG